MNREEIKRIGIDAGISEFAFGLASEEAWQQVERFVALVISVEREACAEICEQLQDWPENATPYDCAAAIRIRSAE